MTEHTRAIDITGQRFGRATVIKRVPNKSKANRSAKWLCKCDCGNEFETRGNNLRSGETQSCGCYGEEQRLKSITTHGLRHTKLHECWSNMKCRCLYPSHASYESYGARGITVCREWSESFQTFYDWAMANGYKDGLTIERNNVNGNYEPDNCRWITSQEQMFNTRIPKDNKSGHKGVIFKPDSNKYYAFVVINRRQKSLGYFDTYDEAVTAREAGERKYYVISSGE